MSAAVLIQSMAPSGDLEILVFGDSLTEHAHWPAVLQHQLSHSSRKVRVDQIAKSGAGTRWAVRQIEAMVEMRPQIILIELYANDAAVHRLVTLKESRENIAAILDQLNGRLPHGQIFMMGMNPFWGIKRVVRPFLNHYLEAHSQEVVARGGGFIDFREDWLRLSKDELQEAIPDGAHPRPERATAIMMPKLLRLLEADKDARSAAATSPKVL